MMPSRFSLQARLAGTFGVVLAILGAGIWLQETRDQQRAEQTRLALRQEKTAQLDKIIQLTGTPLRFFTGDYSPWDEMVNFVAHPDIAWADTNIHDPLGNFKIEAVWVLRLDGTRVYATTLEPDPTLQELPLPPAALQAMYQRQSLHCFVSTAGGLLEIRGEPIRLSSDLNHPERAAGWLLAAERWDDERLESLAGLVNATVSLVPPGARPVEPDPRKLEIAIALPDWEDKPLRYLLAVDAPPALRTLEEDRTTDLAVFVVCGAAILFTLLVATYRWLVRPLRLLTASLAHRDPRQLPSLASSSREFHEIGRLMERSFEQERELRQAFEAFNAIDEAVFIVNVATHRISYVNDGALRVLGSSRQQVLQARLDDLLRPEIGSPGRAAQDARPGTLHYARAYRDSQELELECRQQALLTEGSPTHYVVVARDVTERRAQEKQRLRAQRLESLGALAGGVAHDLNNMLTPVALLLEDISDPRNRPPPDLVASVRISVKRAASMLRQLLTFGRGVEGERKPIAIAALCADLGRIVNSTFPKSVRLELEVPANAGGVLGDATQLHQVLLNLCVNARDAMPEGGVLHIEASPLHITSENRARWPEATPGNYVLIEVRDTGHGIPPEIVDRIFEPFFTTKTQDKGTGLGLSTTLGIVRGHSGSITVESVPGRGTTFRVALPAIPESAGAAHDLASRECPGEGRTVLVVEDEPLVVRTLLAHLLQNGWKVVTAADGAAGMAVFMEHRAEVALVLTDISMAGTDGLEMARRIHGVTPTVPIVVMSGRVDEVQRARMQELRLQHVLYKPFTRSELFDTLRQALVAGR